MKFLKYFIVFLALTAFGLAYAVKSEKTKNHEEKKTITQNEDDLLAKKEKDISQGEDNLLTKEDSKENNLLAKEKEKEVSQGEDNFQEKQEDTTESPTA